MSSTNDTNIAREAEKIEASHVEQFRQAIGSKAAGFPLTYPTLYRATEFACLEQLGLKLENVLHTEQAYEYLEPLEVGDQPKMETQLTSHRERRGMHFLVMETKISVNGKTKVIATANFMVRPEGTEK